MPAGSPDRASVRFLIVILAAVGVAFVAAYARVIATLIHEWSTSSVYSYGYLVPLISAYCVWRSRTALLCMRVRPSLLAGSVVVLGAGLLLLLGRMIAIVGLGDLSLVLMVGGLSLLLLGRDGVLALSFPIGYLLLMLPVWDGALDYAHQPFQLFSASVAAWLTRLAGVPVYLDGQYLVLPSIALEVGRACSGVGAVVAVIAVGTAAGYLLLARITLRIYAVVIAVGVALVANALRIALIAVLAYHQFGASLHGPWHVLTGVFVSTVGYVVLFAAVALLKRYDTVNDRASPVQALYEPSHLPEGTFLAAATVAIVILVMCAAISPQISAPSPTFHPPSTLGSWRLTSSRDAGSLTVPSPDPDELAYIYSAPDGATVTVVVTALTFRTASGGITYREVASDSEALTTTVGAGSVEAVRIRRAISANQQKYHAYWYVVSGVITPEARTAKLLTSLALVRRSRLGFIVVFDADLSRPGDRDLVETFVCTFASLFRTA